MKYKILKNLQFYYQENVIVVQINEKYLTNREHIFDIEESEQYFVDVEEILTKDGKLEIVYHRPNGYTPLLELKEYADFYKLDIVNRLLEMNVLEKTNTYLAMQNILLKDTRDLLFIYKADHFGNLPYSTKEELEQWKNFICSFFGKYTLEKYEKNRIEVLAKEKNSFLNDIEAVESLESLRDLIKNRLTEEQKNFFSTELQDKKAVQGSSDHLLKLSAKERADEATEAFESWYTSFSNGDGILEINKELLKEGSGGTSPIELQTKLIDNLKAKFGDKVSDDFYTSLQTSFNFNPVIVDGTKGLTISKQNDDDSQWLNTWFLDTEKTEQNTKIVFRNDFPFEWVDWRNDARHREAYKNIFTQLDWDNDLSYEVVGINLTESKKNVEGVSIAFVIMKYNEKLGKWQVTGSIGGII